MQLFKLRVERLIHTAEHRCELFVNYRFADMLFMLYICGTITIIITSMKKGLLLLTWLCAALAGRAQVYERDEMLKNDRTWNLVLFQKKETGMTPIYVSYKIVGTEIVEGEECKTLYYAISSDQSQPPNYSFSCYMKQIGNKVSVMSNGCWELLFDFNLQVGDLLPWNDQVIGRGYTKIGNNEFEVISTYTTVWVIGIGNLYYGPFNSLHSFISDIDSYGTLCFEVIDGKTPVYSIEDKLQYLITEGICDKSQTEQKKKLIYDLQGRRLSAKPAKGVYIEDGKKWGVK